MSVVDQYTIGGVLLDHVERLRFMERGGSPWVYVGTVGVDGVDGLITPESPPFMNGWTNSLGDDPPVSFTRINGWVHIRGGFFGGADGSIVFTLPVGYRPSLQQQMVIGTGDPAHIATAVVGANGDVTFGTTI